MNLKQTKEVYEIDNVRVLFALIKNKSKLMSSMADDFGKSEHTLRRHWFSDSGNWSYPKDQRDKIIKYFQKWISNGNPR